MSWTPLSRHKFTRSKVESFPVLPIYYHPSPFLVREPGGTSNQGDVRAEHSQFQNNLIDIGFFLLISFALRKSSLLQDTLQHRHRNSHAL
jgi:hypothetical protein